ncbi:MAG TPA: hypothetical protein PLM22_09260 [Candidatus Sabulitectum sp.]|nr:hypothetical protein [Candidatus Sabulitectum sp.]HPF32676.1 hypothetical protein [Candidatus Sabulitectum sp.]HPJ29108.1 hypothetical protein [Candidatus Sabulitectum sp.]HPR22976.1 hypothetical protein [Candidatus Sabulitectum sp.]HRW77432.1 hypothetical protein [Candidatus Sabulitectum sp.]
MIIADILIALLFALLLSTVLGWGLRWRHPGRGGSAIASAMFLFVVLFVTMWLAALIIPEWGPIYSGSSWLGMLLAGLFISLIILAVATPDWRRRPAAASEEGVEVRESAAVFGCFFWALLILFLMVLILGPFE